MVEHLPSKALSSNSSTAKKKKRKIKAIMSELPVSVLSLPVKWACNFLLSSNYFLSSDQVQNL
jgi:hypothetical protein